MVRPSRDRDQRLLIGFHTPITWVSRVPSLERQPTQISAFVDRANKVSARSCPSLSNPTQSLLKLSKVSWRTPWSVEAHTYPFQNYQVSFCSQHIFPLEARVLSGEATTENIPWQEEAWCFTRHQTIHACHRWRFV